MAGREVRDRTLATACRTLIALPARRLFQYRGKDGGLHAVRASDVNAFLREVSGVQVSLRDFRTLVASAGVMKTLSQARPAATQRARKALLREAIAAAHDLTNTPTVCRESYVHETVIAAFEQGDLPSRAGRTLEGAAQALATVVARHR
jgi:DNA topoisomerase-1